MARNRDTEDEPTRKKKKSTIQKKVKKKRKQVAVFKKTYDGLEGERDHSSGKGQAILGGNPVLAQREHRGNG